MAITVALAFAPQAVAAVGRLRTRPAGSAAGPTAVCGGSAGLAMPVLEGALERSVDLAAAMDARGFGRRGSTPVGVRRATAALTLGGLLAMVASSYGLIDRGAPGSLGVPVLVAGAALTAAGFALGARRGGRTRLSAGPLAAAPSGSVALTGVAAATAMILGPAAALSPSTLPLSRRPAVRCRLPAAGRAASGVDRATAPATPNRRRTAVLG